MNWYWLIVIVAVLVILRCIFAINPREDIKKDPLPPIEPPEAMFKHED